MNLNPNNLLGWAISPVIGVLAAALYAYVAQSAPGWAVYGGVALIAVWAVLATISQLTKRVPSAADSEADLADADAAA